MDKLGIYEVDAASTAPLPASVSTAPEAKGTLSDLADYNLRRLEPGAFERAMVAKHEACGRETIVIDKSLIRPLNQLDC